MFALSMSPSQVVAFERQNEIDAAEAGAGRRGDGGRATKPPGHLGDGLAHDFFSNLCDAWRRDWRWDGRAPDSDYEMCADALFMLRAVAAAVLKRAQSAAEQRADATMDRSSLWARLCGAFPSSLETLRAHWLRLEIPGDAEEPLAMDESPAEDAIRPRSASELCVRVLSVLTGQLVEWLERGVPAKLVHCYLDNIEKWAELALQLSWKPPPREGGVHMTDPTVATHDGLGWRRRLGSELVEVLVKHEIEQAMIARRVISAAMMIVPVSDAAELATTVIRSACGDADDAARDDAARGDAADDDGSSGRRRRRQEPTPAHGSLGSRVVRVGGAQARTALVIAVLSHHDAMLGRWMTAWSPGSALDLPTAGVLSSLMSNLCELLPSREAPSSDKDADAGAKQGAGADRGPDATSRSWLPSNAKAKLSSVLGRLHGLLQLVVGHLHEACAAAASGAASLPSGAGARRRAHNSGCSSVTSLAAEIMSAHLDFERERGWRERVRRWVEHERTPGELDVLKHLPMLVFKMEQFDIALCTLAKLLSPRPIDASHGDQQVRATLAAAARARERLAARSHTASHAQSLRTSHPTLVTKLAAWNATDRPPTDPTREEDRQIKGRDKAHATSASAGATGKRSKRRRLHSRNPAIDCWLSEESGGDTYADLEGFIA